jgi:hypothetical protein
MKPSMTRREALRNLAMVAGSLLAVHGVVAQAAGKPAAKPAAGAKPEHLSGDDPMAEALSYHENARTVSTSEFPTYKPGQKCATCLQSKGKDGEPWRACNVLPGVLVNAEGWCQVYARKA